MDEKVPCVECGKPVAATLAGKRNGLCLRCSANRNPFFVLYSSLIARVCNSPEGFRSLSEAEQLYYALTLFQNEINNGGFHQFFFNSSGSYYEVIEGGLVTFDEPKMLELLHRAKQSLFPEIAVPVDTSARRERSSISDPTDDLMAEVDKLDQEFYRHPDTLSPKLEAFARQRRLVSAEPESKPAQS